MNACRSTASALLASMLIPTVIEKVREDDENLVINDMKRNYDAHTPSMLTKEGIIASSCVYLRCLWKLQPAYFST